MAATSSKEAKMAINGPIFFLVQEQAKSVVAIQALQTRMAVLESLQERLMQAIDDVNQHLSSSKETKSSLSSSKSSSKNKTTEKKLRFDETGTTTRKLHKAANGKLELAKSDSFNKDSGIGGSESDSSLVHVEHTTIPHEQDDELLQLLDIICEKSLVLRESEISGPQQVSQIQGLEMGDTRYLDDLLFDKVNAQRQLSEVKAERDDLKQRLAKLELATETVTKQKLVVQRQLDATIEENQSLQERIHRSDEGDRRTESLGYLIDVERANIRRKYMQFSEKSRNKVSSILKERNVLELQKQLLSYVMENDVLRAKLDQSKPSKVNEWLRIESRLRKEIREFRDHNAKLREILQSKDLEIASLKDKIRSLEEFVEGEDDDSCVKNFGMDSAEDWREPGAANMYKKRSNLNTTSPFSPLGYGDFSKTQSLPAMLLDAQAQLREQNSSGLNYEHRPLDTSNFTDVPLNQSFQSNMDVHTNGNVNNLLDLSPTEPKYPSSSTLVQSSSSHFTLACGLSAPNLSGMCNHDNLQNWVFAPRKNNTQGFRRTNNENGGAKQLNAHLCWKGTKRPTISNDHLSNSDDLSSICTEFDPLSEDNPSGETFVDSLNLSIPLKPTQVAMSQLSSQLSSIGDSLHSTSLDIVCASTPFLYQQSRKVSTARSVDGIRELLLENGYYKRPHAQYGRSALKPVLGRVEKHMPVNTLINCMHDSSDYSLL